MELKGLYAITDPVLTPYENGEIFEKVKSALRGGAKLIQLRDKQTPIEELFPIALKLKELCEEAGAIFLINDRVDLAIRCNAHGVHLGKEDMSPFQAREVLGPNKILGVSCYGDVEKARSVRKVASYVAFGSFYPSPTKPEAPCIPKEVLKKAKKELDLPVCAIGGITPERAKELVNLGADMVAVISSLWKAKDIEEQARKFAELFKAPSKS